MAKNKDNKQAVEELLQMLQGLGGGTEVWGGGQQGFPNYGPFPEPQEPGAPLTPGIDQGLLDQFGWGGQTETVAGPQDPMFPGKEPDDIQQGSWKSPWAPGELNRAGLSAGMGLPGVDTPNLGWSPVAYAGYMGAQGQVGSAYINALSRAHTDPLTAISRERAKSIGDLLNVVAGGQQERETIGVKSEEERQTQEDAIAGELAKIYASAGTGTAGKLAEIGLGGEEERLTGREKAQQTLHQIRKQAAEERHGTKVSGAQERQTQAQLLAGQLGQITQKGQQERLTARTSGEQERQTLAKQLAGVLGQIGAKGGEERLTQAQQLEGVMAQLTEKGTQESGLLAAQLQGALDQIAGKGGEERETLGQRIEGELGTISRTGQESRETQREKIMGELGTIGATGRETRETQRQRALQAQQNMAAHAGLLRKQQAFGANLLQNMPMPDFTNTQAYQDLTGMAGQGMRQTNAMNMLGGPNPFAAPLQNIPGMVGGDNSMFARQNMYNMQNQFNPAARAQHAQSAMTAGRNLANQYNQQLATQTAAGRPFRSATGQVLGAVPQIYGQQVAGMSNIGIS